MLFCLKTAPWPTTLTHTLSLNLKKRTVFPETQSPCMPLWDPLAGLQTLRITSQALRLAFKPLGLASRPSGWPPNTQTDLPGLLASSHTLRVAS